MDKNIRWHKKIKQIEFFRINILKYCVYKMCYAIFIYNAHLK